jgi:transposase InsO family protein
MGAAETCACGHRGCGPLPVAWLGQTHLGVMRDGPKSACRAASAGLSGSPVHRRAVDAPQRSARYHPGEGPADHGARHRAGHRPDLVERVFTATGPELWVADITHCRTCPGWVTARPHRRVLLAGGRLVAVEEPAHRPGVGRPGDGHLNPPPRRPRRDRAVHHSDKGSQYLAVRYTRRMAEAGGVASVGSTDDSHDNALAEAFNSLFNAELSAAMASGRASTTSRSPSPSTSTGSTTDACTVSSA